MKRLLQSPFLAAIVTLAACGDIANPTPTADDAGTSAQAPAGYVPQNDRPKGGYTPGPDDDPPIAQEPYKNGAAAFNEVRDALLKSYYAEGLSEDDVYRAATAGKPLRAGLFET